MVSPVEDTAGYVYEKSAVEHFCKDRTKPCPVAGAKHTISKDLPSSKRARRFKTCFEWGIDLERGAEEEVLNLA